MNFIANGFILLYCIDGVLSFIDDLSPGIPVLSLLRNLVAAVCFFSSIAMYILLAVTPRLSKRIFFPPVFYLLFTSLVGGMPLQLYFGWQKSLAILSGLQLLVGLLTLAQIRYSTPGRRWLLTEAAFKGPLFRLINTLGFIGINLVLIIPGTILYLILCLSLTVTHYTAGFLHLRPSGLEAEAREYICGPKTVCLIPMAHIGDARFYAEIGQAYTGRQTVAITEGVTDTNGCLRSFRNVNQKLAATVGLEAQKSDMFTNSVVIKHADVDASVFSPETLRMLNAVGATFQARTPLEVLTVLARYENEFNGALIVTLKHDLLDQRNLHCADVMEAVLAEHDCLIVPWGAGHMPFFEQFLIDRGFKQSQVTRRMVIQFSHKPAAPAHRNN